MNTGVDSFVVVVVVEPVFWRCLSRCHCCRGKHFTIEPLLHNPPHVFHTYLPGGAESTFVERSVVFLSDVEVLVWSSVAVGFARSASDEPEARLADFALGQGKVWSPDQGTAASAALSRPALKLFSAMDGGWSGWLVDVLITEVAFTDVAITNVMFSDVLIAKIVVNRALW